MAKNIKSENIENVSESEILRSVPLQGNWNSLILVIHPGKSVKWRAKFYLKMAMVQTTSPPCQGKIRNLMKVPACLHGSMLTLRSLLNSSTPSSRVGKTRKQSQNTPLVNPISNLPRSKSTSVSTPLNPHRRPPRSQHNHKYRPFTSLSGLQFYNELLYRDTHTSNLRRPRSDFRSLYFHSSESGTLT